MFFKDINPGTKFLRYLYSENAERTVDSIMYMRIDFSKYMASDDIKKWYNSVSLVTGHIEWFHDTEEIIVVNS